MRSFEVLLTIRAECVDDAEELLNDFSGSQSDLSIKRISIISELEHDTDVSTHEGMAKYTKLRNERLRIKHKRINKNMQELENRKKWNKRHE